MRVEYSKRAPADLRQIAAYYARSGNSAIADRIAERIQQVISWVAVSPSSGRAVVRRPGVRVALLPGYRYKIFYQVAGERDRGHPHVERGRAKKSGPYKARPIYSRLGLLQRCQPEARPGKRMEPRLGQAQI